MIITKQKQFDDLLRSIGSKPVFLIGCNECATLCHAGGKDEIIAVKNALEEKQIQVTGWVILEPACHRMNDIRMLKDHTGELANSSKILVFACGNGVQTIASILPDKEVIAGTDTLFLGEISHVNEFHKQCVLCGECLVDFFDGLCPVSQCPKSMLNGPCGGSFQGKCEVSSQLDCVWDQIIQRLKKRGALERLSVIQKPKDWSLAGVMERRI